MAVRGDIEESGRAVRDDVKRRERVIGDDVGKQRRAGRVNALWGEGVLLFDVIPGPPQAEPGIQWLGCDGLCRALSAWVAQALAERPSGSRLGATRRPG